MEPAKFCEKLVHESHYLVEVPWMYPCTCVSWFKGYGRMCEVAQSLPSLQATTAMDAAAQFRQHTESNTFVKLCHDGDAARVRSFLSQNAPKGLGDCEEALFDVHGDSALHHAVSGGHAAVTKLLLELGSVEVDIPNARNETSLQLACRKADESTVSLLLKATADPNRRDAN
eukprot:3021162-Amphidinium_carterae.1